MPKTTKYVKKAFTLLHDGEKHEFSVGQVLPEQFHEHWYAQAHSGDHPVAADAGTAAAADELLAELEAKAKKLDEREKALAAATAALDVRVADLTDREQKLAARAKELDARDGDHVTRARTLDEREAALAEREKASEAAAKQQGGKK